MNETDELSLEFIDELLAPKEKEKPTPKSYPRPEYTSTYIKSIHTEQRCKGRGCGAPTYILIKDEPFCTIHAIGLLGDLLDEKINHYPSSVPTIERILQAYIELGNHTPTVHENRFARTITIDRSEDHREFVVTADYRQYTYSAYTSPEGVLIQSLLDMLG